MENPLHPFELHSYGHLSLFGLDISLNKAVIMMWIIIALAAWFLIQAGRERRLIPSRLQSIAEMLVEFLRGMIMDTIGKEGMRFFPFIGTLFIFCEHDGRPYDPRGSLRHGALVALVDRLAAVCVYDRDLGLGGRHRLHPGLHFYDSHMRVSR